MGMGGTRCPVTTRQMDSPLNLLHISFQKKKEGGKEEVERRFRSIFTKQIFPYGCSREEGMGKGEIYLCP